MCAWLVESFEPQARLTSVAIGYNIANMVAGGITPFLATVLVDRVGPGSPGWVVSVYAAISMAGLLCVAPPPPSTTNAVSASVEMPKKPYTPPPPSTSNAVSASVEMPKKPSLETVVHYGSIHSDDTDV
jgi:MFS family permease